LINLRGISTGEREYQLNQALVNIILRILESTNGKALNLDETKESLKITSELFNKIIEKIRNEDLLPSENELKLSIQQRIGLAIMALEVGADFQRVSNNLGWLEFEELVAYIFEENGFKVLRRYRFQAQGRRWEIDVLASRYPHIICTECKHFTKGIGDSIARGISETHLEKTEVFSGHIGRLSKKIGIHTWKDAIITPLTLTLTPTKMKIYRRVPSVSIFVLPKYLSEFQGQLERIAHFKVNIPKNKSRPKQLRLR
jgi:hypothetical protein